MSNCCFSTLFKQW